MLAQSVTCSNQKALIKMHSEKNQQQDPLLLVFIFYRFGARGCSSCAGRFDWPGLPIG
jgi:hypothetical protein